MKLLSEEIYSDEIIATIQSSHGNCTEKAILAGIFLKATISENLRQRSFSDLEIEKGGINIVIGDLGNDGDHCVCVLTHEINGGFHIVDSWMNGSVYNIMNARDFFAANLRNSDVSYEFGYRIIPSEIVNEAEIVTNVMAFAKDFLGDRPEFSDLFKK